MEQNTIILKLKDPLLNYKGKPFKNVSALGLSQQQIMQTPEAELLRVAPDDKIGDQIALYLVGIIQPKNPEDAARLSRWAAKINNKMITEKGELELDEKDIKELLSIFTSGTIPVKNSNTLGAIIIYLEQKQIELVQKTRSPDIKNS